MEYSAGEGLSSFYCTAAGRRGQAGRKKGANPAGKTASCTKVTGLREKCGKTKKADENANEKKRKKLEDDCANMETQRETSIKHGNTKVEDC